MSTKEDSPFEAGEVVQARFIQHLREQGQALMWVAGMYGYLSWYDMSDNAFENLRFGDVVDAVVDRIGTDQPQPYLVLKTQDNSR